MMSSAAAGSSAKGTCYVAYCLCNRCKVRVLDGCKGGCVQDAKRRCELHSERNLKLHGKKYFK